MIEFMRSQFGTYQPFVNPETGAISPDFEYIAAVLIFAICLFGVFKILTAVFRRK